MNAVNLDAKFAKFAEHWSPKIIAQLNDLHVKAVKVKGEFFYVHKGVMTIRLRDRDVVLHPGEMFVVPKGVEHMPVASEECEMLLIEPAGTVNTGDAGGDKTALVEPWI
jgi:mannose-6-phosphate isomerase-like protein (cupin superfamily)